MNKVSLNFLFVCIFCLVGISAFSQNSEDVIVLKMPNKNSQITSSETKVTPVSTKSITASNDPIFIADGIVIENLNILDPSTIVSVDVVVNKVIITTTKSKTTKSEPSIAANF